MTKKEEGKRFGRGRDFPFSAPRKTDAQAFLGYYQGGG